MLAFKIQSGCHLCSWTVPDKAELLGLLQQPRPGFEFDGGSKAWSRPVNSLTQAGKGLRRALELFCTLRKTFRKRCSGLGLTCCLNPPKPTWSLGPQYCALPVALMARPPLSMPCALCLLPTGILSLESHFTGWGHEAQVFRQSLRQPQLGSTSWLNRKRPVEPSRLSSQNTLGGRREPTPSSCPLIVLHCNTCPSPNHI